MDMARKIFLHGNKEKYDNNEQTVNDQQLSIANFENENLNNEKISSEDSEELVIRDLSKTLKQKTSFMPKKFVNFIDNLIERSVYELMPKKEDKFVRRPSMPFRIG
jgi:hypothetical protein